MINVSNAYWKKIRIFLIVLFAAIALIEIIVYANMCFNKDLDIAKGYFNNKEYSKAASLCLNLIERDTNQTTELYILCADIYLECGDYNSAHSLLSDAIKNGIDSELISQKISGIDTTKNSTSLNLTEEYEVYSDRTIIVFISIFLTTLFFIVLILLVPYFIHLFNKFIKNETDDISLNYHEADELLPEAIRICIKSGYATSGLIQRNLKIKHKRAVKIIEQMEYYGITDSLHREILTPSNTLEQLVSEQNHSVDEDSEERTVEQILKEVDAMSENGWEFEKFTADLLLKNGFKYAEATSGSNDYGVDVVATDERDVKYAIQCKCYSNKLNNKSVQEVIAGKTLYNCQVGVVFTNNFFTENAKELAKVNNVLLWDREKLIEFIKNQ